MPDPNSGFDRLVSAHDDEPGVPPPNDASEHQASLPIAEGSAPKAPSVWSIMAPPDDAPSVAADHGAANAENEPGSAPVPDAELPVTTAEDGWGDRPSEKDDTSTLTAILPDPSGWQPLTLPSGNSSVKGAISAAPADTAAPSPAINLDPLDEAAAPPQPLDPLEEALQGLFLRTPVNRGEVSRIAELVSPATPPATIPPPPAPLCQPPMAPPGSATLLADDPTSHALATSCAHALRAAKRSAYAPTNIILSEDVLGPLCFSIQTQGDTVTVTLSAERTDTLHLMRQNQDQLLATLQQAGFASATLDWGDWSDHPGNRQPSPDDLTIPGDPGTPVVSDALTTDDTLLDLRL